MIRLIYFSANREQYGLYSNIGHQQQQLIIQLVSDPKLDNCIHPIQLTLVISDSMDPAL